MSSWSSTGGRNEGGVEKRMDGIRDTRFLTS